MTKKSPSRLARDAEKKNTLEGVGGDTQFDYSVNTAWDDLAAAMQGAENILTPILEFARSLSHPENAFLKDFYPDYRSTSLNMVTFGRDLQRVYGEFLTIKNLHAHRTGNAGNETEMMECYRLISAYAALIENMNGTLLPTFNHLNEDVYVARNNYHSQQLAKEKAAQEQDPNVVTDVEPRDVVVADAPSTVQ